MPETTREILEKLRAERDKAMREQLGKLITARSKAAKKGPA